MKLCDMWDLPQNNMDGGTNGAKLAMKYSKKKIEFLQWTFLEIFSF